MSPRHHGCHRSAVNTTSQCHCQHNVTMSLSTQRHNVTVNTTSQCHCQHNVTMSLSTQRHNVTVNTTSQCHCQHNVTMSLSTQRHCQHNVTMSLSTQRHNVTVNKVKDICLKPLCSPMQLLVSSQHLCRLWTAGSIAMRELLVVT